MMWFVQIISCLQKIGVALVFAIVENFCFFISSTFRPWSTPYGGFTKWAKVLQKNVWLGHYPKGSTVFKIGSYFLVELFRVFSISNE